jgi:hypothetical protein
MPHSGVRLSRGKRRDRQVIVEMREYTMHPGKVSEYLRLYEAEGLSVQRSILGTMLGYFQTEIGPLNQVVHLWAYESFDEREQRRARLAEHPAWQAYLKKMRPLLAHQETRIMRPAPFMKLEREA